MGERKQQLLKAHRRNKRLSLLASIIVLLMLGLFVAWWLVPSLLLLGWVAHEAWFADHLFYSPREDYLYRFSGEARQQRVRLAGGKLQLTDALSEGETLILQIRLRSTWLGHWVDPYVVIGEDRQDFERGVSGIRYLNLSGQADSLRDGSLRLLGKHCQLPDVAELYVLTNPDFSKQRVMVLAPHSDDAELAAFGLYSRSKDACIVTVTQGEIEAESYQRLGLGAAQAATLKGRLRSWDSLAIPLWGGVPQSRCVQLGYYCLQLSAMAAEPQIPYGSRESGETDIRSVRANNPLRLPGDERGEPTWQSLIADLTALLEHFRPQVIVMPHPELDPHIDHVAATQAMHEAVERSGWKPEVALLYANHLHDNDRWPMGPAGGGIALPPSLNGLPVDRLWSPLLTPERQLDKAMALAMQHDLQGFPPFKKRIRRLIQSLLAGRRWPATGEDEFFRKAVRRHELFWVRYFPR